MINPLYKIILCDYINPKNDNTCLLIRGGALVLKRSLSGYRIIEKGQQKNILKRYRSKRSIEIVELNHQLAMPSFFDMHFHWVQSDVCLKPKHSLLKWLQKYTWPNEAKFHNKRFSLSKAKEMRQALLSVGTLGGACYASIHQHTVTHAINNFVGDFIVGNVLMTMNSPKNLTQSELAALSIVKNMAPKLKKKFAFTPRFALTTSPRVMREGAIFCKRYGSFIQTHLSETKSEIKQTLKLYRQIPDFKQTPSYTKIYEDCHVLGPKTIMGHAIHLSNEELLILKKSKTVIAHCPTSNAPKTSLGLASGLFNFKKAEKYGLRWVLGSDIGAGPYLSMFDVMQSFVGQNRVKGNSSATYIKALFRSTLACAKALELDKTHGNLEVGKYANFITVPSPKYHKDECAETVLRDLIEPHFRNREKYTKLVQNTFYKGQLFFSR